MNQIVFFIVFVTISISTATSQITCKGIIENLPSNAMRSVVIEYWSEDRWIESDTTNLGNDNSFHKKISHDNVQARLRIRGKSANWLDFIIPPYPSQDSIFDFGILDYNSMNGWPAKLSSKENEAYFTLISDYKRYKILKDNIAKNDSMVIVDPGVLNTLEGFRITLNDHCNKFETKLKGSFTGDILTKMLYIPIQSEYVNDKKVQELSSEEFERKHLLDRIPFGDKRILLHNSLIKTLTNYQSKFSKTDSSDLYLFINRVMYKRQNTKEVDSWLFHFLFNKFVNTRDDISLTYLLKYYVTDCDADESNPNQNTNNMLVALKNCEVGKKAVNMNLPDTMGTLRSLSEIASRNKTTVLFFWRSDCSHCREFEPELAEIYKKYKPLGLEVIGVSLDIDEFKWRIFLETNPMSWINLHVADLEQRELINKNFPISGTPALIAVDKNYNVLNRMVIRTSLDQYLDQLLRK